MSKIIAFVVVFTLSDRAHAWDCGPHVHLLAFHSEDHYETVTPGLGALCHEDTRLLGAGAYRNSLGKGSAYAAGGWQPIKIKDVRIGVIAGIVTGYMDTVVPLGAVFVSVGKIHLSIIPKVEGKTPATLGLSVSF